MGQCTADTTLVRDQETTMISQIPNIWIDVLKVKLGRYFGGLTALQSDVGPPYLGLSALML